MVAEVDMEVEVTEAVAAMAEVRKVHFVCFHERITMCVDSVLIQGNCDIYAEEEKSLKK